MDLDYKTKHTIYDKNPDAQNIPEFVKIGRKLHKGKTLYELSQKYYSTLPLFAEDKPQNNNDLEKIIDNSLSLIESFILCEKKTWNSFDIKKVPLIENALLHYTVYGNNYKLKETYKLVKHFPELSMLIKSKMYYLGKLGILKVTKIGNSNFYQVNSGIGL